MSDFDIRFKENDDLTELTILMEGTLSLNEATSQRQTLKTKLDRLEPYKVVKLDLSDLKYVDSSGIGLFIYLKKYNENKETKFFVQNPSKTARYILELTGLTETLDII